MKPRSCLRCGDPHHSASPYCWWCTKRREQVLRQGQRREQVVELWQLAAWAMTGKTTR